MRRLLAILQRIRRCGVREGDAAAIDTDRGMMMRPPDRLLFEYGPFPFCRAVQYRVRGGWVFCMTDDCCNPGRNFRRCKPLPEDWLTFWHTIAPLRIWRWKEDYIEAGNHGHFVLHGQGWRFTCQQGRRRVVSCGGGYHPEIMHPERPTTSCEAIGLLISALEILFMAQQPIADQERERPADVSSDSTPPREHRSPSGAAS